MKHEDLPKISKIEFLYGAPSMVHTKDGHGIRSSAIVDLYNEWDAAKVLNLNKIRAGYRLYIILIGAMLPKELVCEYMFRCAEWALSLVDNPDPRLVEALRIGRLVALEKATFAELCMAAEMADNAEKDAVAADDCLVARVVAKMFRATVPGDTWEVINRATKVKTQRIVLPISIDDEKESAYEQELKILSDLIDEWEE